MHSLINNKDRDASRTQCPPKWTAAIRPYFLFFLSGDAFCTFVDCVSVSELTQLNAVGCGDKGVSNNQDRGRSIVGPTMKCLQRCC